MARLASRWRAAVGVLVALAATAALATPVRCPSTLPVEGGAVRSEGPALPPDNPWNVDVSGAPVDARSDAFIRFIDNGGTRHLHPDLGGEAGGDDIYGMPYAVVDGAATPRAAVVFDYADESDGVDHASGTPLPFYPIPSAAATQARWVEGGAPGNVDQRDAADRHLLIVDCRANALYELYNVWYDTAHAQWYAGSGAYFDLASNARRPEGWTSADAAGLAIFPGLIRYDEAWDAAVADIGHAFRVTVRATNGHVYPASHTAGATSGALPMGARLRLKTSVNGADPALRTGDPNVRKIFRAMQRYGLIVADNGSDLYVGGTFDTRWNNDILNPAFAQLAASDFEVVQLGWTPSTTTSPPPPPPPPPSTVTVVEYRYPDWNHYFMTASPSDIAIMDSGVFPGWERTGLTFLAYPLEATVGTPVCRFFSASFAPRSSHFYSAIPTDCAAVMTFPAWVFEGNAFRALLPADDGACASGTEPLYRLYNDGQGGAPNHRYTTDLGVRAGMIAQGWIPEGRGALGVNACVPAP